MLGDKKLSELVAAHHDLRYDLRQAKQSLEGCERQIKLELIDLRAVDCLSVNWSRVRKIADEQD